VPGSDGLVLFDSAGAATLVGQAAARWVNTRLQGRAKVAIMGDYSMENGVLRMAGAQDAMIAACPGAEVVYAGSGLLAAEAQATTESLLVKYPDLKVIICHADDGALGAAQAFANADVDITDVWIAGYDGSLPALEKAVSGTSPLRHCAALPLYEIGVNSVSVADNARRREGTVDYIAPYIHIDVENKTAGVALINAYVAVLAGASAASSRSGS